jgi:peptidoglycan/LPS O-acetylase OafA/YrhL
MKIGKHIEALDGVRGVAILGVLLVHLDIQLPALGPLLPLGAFGVDLFFVLSGFLITGILLDAKESPRYFSTFYARRSLRLFPIYRVYLAAVFYALPAIHAALHTSIPDYTGPRWWYVFYLSNWKTGGGAHDPFLGHFWSLAVEEQFYLLWSVMIWAVPRRYVPLVCLISGAGALALRIALFASGADWNVPYRITFARMDALALGGLAALYRERSFPWLKSASISAFAVFLSVVFFARSVEWSRPVVGTVGATALAAGFAGTIHMVQQASLPTLRRWLCMPGLVDLGKYSYGLYVLHIVVYDHVFWLAAFLERKHPGAEWISRFVALAGSYAAARVSWAFIEQPALRMKRYFQY